MIKAILPFVISIFDGMIKRHREDNDTVYDYADGRVKILTYHNRGAFLNMGDSKPLVVLLLSIGLTAILSFVFLVSFGRRGTEALRTGLAFLLGGAFSNTYDRLKKGYVVDYLNFPKAPFGIKNVIFNLSDFAIIIGSLISVLANRD